MLDLLLKLYLSFMKFDERGLIPVLVGPPGSGKSTVAEQLAVLVGKKLHIVAVARTVSTEVEGIQVPVTLDVQEGESCTKDTILKMIPAAYWQRLEEGDVVLFDEFLRGFDDVYNALLDIFTSRRAGEFHLPKVFMIGASNTAESYDDALDDRMLLIPTPDPRKRKTEDRKIREMLVEAIGLLPGMVESYEMDNLMKDVVHPTFEVLDHILKKDGRKGSVSAKMKGKSVRNLIAQAHLRHVVTSELKSLIDENNSIAMQKGKHQYVVLLGRPPKGYKEHAQQLVGMPKLKGVQRKNVELNLELIELQELKSGALPLEEEEE